MTSADLSSVGPSPYRRVWRLAWPIIVSNSTVPIVGLVDTGVVGHLGDPAFIGGVALGTLLFNYIFWGFGFLRMGTTGLAAQSFGADNHEETKAVLGRALIMAVIFGITVLLLRSWIGEWGLGLLEGSSSVKNSASAYFEICALAVPTALANAAMLGWFLALQDARSGLVQQLVVNIVNVTLDFVLVIGFDMGVEGVAWATVAAHTSGTLVSVFIVRRKLGGLSGEVHWAQSLGFQKFCQIMVVNRDIFIRTVCLLTGTAFFMDRSAAMGEVVLAVNAILMNFQALSAFGLDGFAHAAEALVGKSVGKRDAKALQEDVRASSICGLYVSLLYMALFFFGGSLLVSLMTDIQQVRDLAEGYIIWTVILPILSVWAYMFDGIFIGATRSVEMRNAMLVSFASFLVAGYFLVPMLDNHGLWLAYTFFMSMRGVTLWAYYGRVVAMAER